MTTLHNPDDKAPLLEHLVELRDRLLKAALAVLVGFLFCYAFAESIYGFLAWPLNSAAGSDVKMIFTALHEVFFTYVKVSFYAGLFLALPVVLVQMWLFIAPGLYQHEKKSLVPFIVMTPLLFFIGGAFAYLVVFPVAFHFFLSFSTSAIEAMPKVNEYLDLVVGLMFAFGLSFEVPVALLLLVRAGAVDVAWLREKRRYAIVAAFIIAGVLTPPDPLSQFALAIPLIGLYEISILLGRFMERQRRDAQQENAAAETDLADPHDSNGS
ncbi:MAG: twin-arginine translocase subunit TatC [Magnetococcales bacterium]|nr:twin-arginine translocase subunit TatC [Magnetococcales bacterium]